MRLGPVAFLFAVAIGWAGVRAVMLCPERRSPERPLRIAWQPPLAPSATDSIVRQVNKPAPVHQRLALKPARSVTSVHDAPAPRPQPKAVLLIASSVGRPRPVPQISVSPIYPPVRSDMPPVRISRLSFSAWGILRGRSGPGLASAGQLGGSQAGLRARYDLGNGLTTALRISGPLRSRLGKEAALALDWRPVRQVPVTFTIERRVGLDRGGRDAFAAGIFGGVDAVALPLNMRLDGYAQAGLVGLRRRDGYIDGALRLERTLAGAGRLRLGIGGGAWGGAQPGASRLDLGPQLIAHFPVGNAGLRIGAEWRARVAGQARPGSGPALSIGADF